MRTNEKLEVTDADLARRFSELLDKLKTVKTKEEIAARSVESALKNKEDALLLAQLHNDLKKLRKTKMELFSRINDLKNYR